MFLLQFNLCCCWRIKVSFILSPRLLKSFSSCDMWTVWQKCRRGISKLVQAFPAVAQGMPHSIHWHTEDISYIRLPLCRTPPGIQCWDNLNSELYTPFEPSFFVVGCFKFVLHNRGQKGIDSDKWLIAAAITTMLTGKFRCEV